MDQSLTVQSQQKGCVHLDFVANTYFNVPVLQGVSEPLKSMLQSAKKHFIPNLILLVHFYSWHSYYRELQWWSIQQINHTLSVYLRCKLIFCFFLMKKRFGVEKRSVKNCKCRRTGLSMT